MKVKAHRMREKQPLRDHNYLTDNRELLYWKCKRENDTLEVAVFK